MEKEEGRGRRAQTPWPQPVTSAGSPVERLCQRGLARLSSLSLNGSVTAVARAGMKGAPRQRAWPAPRDGSFLHAQLRNLRWPHPRFRMPEETAGTRERD